MHPRVSATAALLGASLVLNVMLAGVLLRRPSSPAAAAQVSSMPEPTPLAASAKPFRWSDLEAADYPTYIANLRQAGCPEQTVREIILADLQDSFAPRRDKTLERLENARVTAEERKQAKNDLECLREEERAVFNRLFGLVEARPPVALAGSGADAVGTDLQNSGAVMPLVFQQLDTNQLPLNEEQLQVVERVKRSFTAALGSNEDVSSPEYLRRWQSAQKEADELLDTFLGRQTTLDYQTAVSGQKQN